MHDNSTPAPRNWLSSTERQRRRVARGLPPRTDAAIAQRAAFSAKRSAAGREKVRWAEYKARIDAIKLARGCADCGYNAHPAALDFDHLPGAEKRGGLSRMFGMAWEGVEAEIAKCEVVCSNCHRIRTAERRHG